VTAMQINFRELESGIGLITLAGKLDIIGTGEIDTKFAGYCARDRMRLIVDVSEVDFLASIGIRMLILNARSLAGRGGKMVLLSPTPDVENVLDLTGIPGIIPIYSDLESAGTALQTS
jgi:anti-sigma B factor antagonist